MTFSRLVVDENGRTREEALPENFKHAGPEEIARRKMMEAEIARRRPAPFGALNPRDDANHPQPSQKREVVAVVEEEEEADIRENPEGGKTQGHDNPAEAEPQEEAGTDSSEEEGGDENTPDDDEEE